MDFFTASAAIIPLIIAITMHEAAHGFAAYHLGDNTAKLQGRVTLDPFRHVEWFGTIVFPGFLLLSGAPFVFGWAKPVPVNFGRLHHPRRDMLLVAIAGPAMNLALAFVSALCLHAANVVSPEQAPWSFMNLYHSITINIVLAVFNMLPFLPLDGGRVLEALLPLKLAITYAKTERYGFGLILLLFLLPGLLQSTGLLHINPGYYLIYLPADSLRDLVLHAAGIGISTP